MIILNGTGSGGLPFSIRHYEPDDRNLILHSWIQIAAPLQPTKHWPAAAEPRIKELLEDPSCQTLIACSQSEHSRIFGYLVGQRPVAHFAFVKKGYREQGIAHKLLAAWRGRAEGPIMTTFPVERDDARFLYVGIP